jgi:hypothetical protein
LECHALTEMLIGLLAHLSPAWHRAYFRSHPLGFWVYFWIGISGAVGLLFPHLVNESAPAIVLPLWVLTLFNTVWTVGGILGAYGLLRGKMRIEIPGLILLASGLAAYYAAVVQIRAASALQAIFILGLAVGAIERAWQLYHCGYDGVHHP